MIEFNYQNDYPKMDERLFADWLNRIALSESKTIGELSYVFCSDAFLLQINQEHLNHDTYTDIISFDYSNDGLLHGEIYISTDRVQENATAFGECESDEMLRVMAHGLLHLCGYMDSEPDDKALMRKKENEKIGMFHVKQ